MSLDDLQAALATFAYERDWEQFHTPKNLVMALAGEVGELLALFQWLTPEQSVAIMDDPASAEAVRNEVADVASYLLRFTDVLRIDLARAVTDKLAVNEHRYPVELARGSAEKYDKLGQIAAHDD
jgi:dCTP diphosphatase